MERSGRKNRHSLFGRLLVGSLLFVILICALMGACGYFLFKIRMMDQYSFHLSEVINSTENSIDVEKLKTITENYEENEYYHELVGLFDSMRRDFNLEDIVLSVPVKEGNDIKIRQVVSGLLPEERSGQKLKDNPVPKLGEDYGYIFDRNFRDYLYEKFVSSKEIDFVKTKNEFGNTYNATTVIRDAAGNPVADLSAGISLGFIDRTMWSYLLNLLILTVIIVCVLIFTIMKWLKVRVLDPVSKIEKAAVDFEERSHQEKNPDAFVLDMPKLESGDELESLANTLGSMSVSMKRYAEELLESAVKVDILELDLEESKRKAMKLTELATKDALTGIRNKTAYDQEVERIKERLDAGDTFFGIAMIDMNCLKDINDKFGHEKGDEAVRKLCGVVCEVFDHSPVFRIGGDEFAVILRGGDYDRSSALSKEFTEQILAVHSDESLPEWERISAAIGFALFDPELDTYYEDVFKRADMAMYEKKAGMKQEAAK